MRSLKELFHSRYVLAILSVLLTLAVVAGCSMPGANAPAAAAPLPTYAPGITPAATSAAENGSPIGTPAATKSGDGAAIPDAPATTEETATLSETVATAPASGRYSAEIVADQQVVVAAQIGGTALEVLVDVGDEVKTGDVLARIDSTALEAQRAQAMASMEAAKSQLDLLTDPAKEQDLAAARAAVDAAGAAYVRATNGPTDEERRLALAQLKSAEAAVTVAQAGYNRVKGDPMIGMLPQSLQLQQATLGQEAAQAQYDKLMKGATADQVAGAYAQLANARAGLQRLQDGAKPAQVHAAEAQLSAAENALYLAQLQLNKATITAPMDGVVSKLQMVAGALAAPGAPVLTLLSNDVRVTIAVEETRLPQLKIGQPAIIRTEAYPGRTFAGAVAIIAPELDPTTRTVQVTIRPADNDAGLLNPGMSATAELVAQ
ncbi:MAG: efflux RND transporter periplasmic adaptor subunit [Anaerolineales bacterium]|nr:efflux RND transporter periplasmic adaptor subunit [Anaerolineales bacterium]